MDFLRIKVKIAKDKSIEISPQFVVSQSNDLMIRGRDFYAIWDDENGVWSTNEDTAIRLIDNELKEAAERKKKEMPDTPVNVKYMWAADSGSIDTFHKFCQKQMRDNYEPLDMSLIFLDTKTDRTDYSTKRLPYSLRPSDIDAYEELMSTLYDESERLKIEWAIGAILSGDSKWIQKFIVFYGGPGTGKSTVINIIQDLFKGYYSVFDAKSLGSSNDSFALEAFKTNPLVAIQHDGDLSRIEDNTRLNSIISHEEITINEKFKAQYTNRLQCMLIMGTNKPVKITDAKSGITRRLIDIFPSGRKVPTSRYNELVSQIRFELGGIACRCLDIYNRNKSIYDDYIPINMIGATNDFYMFMEEKYEYLKGAEHVTLSWLWDEYKKFCEDAKVAYPLLKRNMKIEAMTYFKEYEERGRDSEGKCLYNVYRGFKTERFTNGMTQKKEETSESWLEMYEQKSILDETLKGCKAQYATDDGTPKYKWDNCKTKLSEIDTTELHYVQPDLNHVVIDFDIPNMSGEKEFQKNLKEALKWKPTYAELSKSGEGIHLHYIYEGDATALSRLYAPNIEIKVFTGNSSLRRKLSKCNNLPIATLTQGCLPEKKGGTSGMINFDGLKNEKMLRNMIKKNLAKQYHSSTASSVDFIYKLLEDANSKGLVYDVRDMRPAITSFACNSTHQSEKCLELVSRMKWCSENVDEASGEESEAPIAFFDVEVFPNLFVVVWKREDGNPQTLINPSPEEIENLCRFRLIGFNNRKYDNHILYARMHGYSNEELYNLSQRIIQNSPNSMFGEAYNLSYTDIYDFSSKKQSLKKFEIELGIHHQELGLEWDKPVDECLWQTVADYCVNDVIATEAVFKAREADFLAREILAEVAGGTVNDTTNSLTTKLIFGKNRHPQDEFHYRNLAEPVTELDKQTRKFLEEECGLPIPFDKRSLLPYFKGYKYENGVSTYRGFEVGEGGFVYSEPDAYSDVALLDVASEHPHSITTECLFGIRYTKAFKDLMDTRILVKHKDFEAAKKMFDGKLARFLDDENKSKRLAQALKIAINSVYGLTAARFENPFRDQRNIDNIVAKRGALFMIDLLYAVQEKGFKVAHIKTDSIKIPNATPEIIRFVMDFGKRYGYTFEHEATYERICLVNDAVYIARYPDGKWTATGTQFQVPFVFKTLFSKENIEFKDMCETKNVKTAMYLDMNEGLPEDEHNYKFVGRTGLYCPIKEGSGGGRLVRVNGDKYDAVVGTKGYRWLEAETVQKLGMEGCIDISYYANLVDDAVKTISQYVVNVDAFANGEDKELWEVPF